MNLERPRAAPAIAVGLALTPAIRVLVLVLARSGRPSLDTVSTSVSFASQLTATLVLALGVAGLARRLGGARAVGAWIAACAFAVLVAFTIMWIGVLLRIQIYGPFQHEVWRWLEASPYVWPAARSIAIAGLALAAGRPRAMLAVLAIASAFLGAPTPQLVTLLQHVSEAVGDAVFVVAYTGLVIVDALLIWLIASGAEVHARPPRRDPARAARAMRLLELVAWASAATALGGAVVGATHEAVPAFVLTVVISILHLAFASGVWSAAHAGLEQMPRALLVVGAAGAVWTVAVIARVWAWTLALSWHSIGSIELGTSPRWLQIPDFAAVVVVIVALAIYARRRRAARVLRSITVFGGIFVAAAIGVVFPLHDSAAGMAAMAAIANVGVARVYRSSAPLLAGDLESTAEVFS